MKNKLSMPKADVEGVKESADPMEEPESYDHHEVKRAFDTLMEGEQIKKKKKLMDHVHKHAQDHVEMVGKLPKMGMPKSISDIKKKASEMS